MLHTRSNQRRRHCSTPALLIIGGVNSKGEEEKWDIGSIGFKGELIKIEWRSGFRYPKTIQDVSDLSRVPDIAANYHKVVRKADADGKQLAKEFLLDSVSKQPVFVLAHSMGTRLAGAFLREIAGTPGASVRLQQVFLFNGAAPIHPGSNFREWALESIPGGVHNFFNPSDPVITALAVLCRFISILPFDNDRLAPPIGNIPTSTVSHNYNTFIIQVLPKSFVILRFSPISDWLFPPPDDPHFVLADAPRSRQSFGNLAGLCRKKALARI